MANPPSPRILAISNHHGVNEIRAEAFLVASATFLVPQLPDEQYQRHTENDQSGDEDEEEGILRDLPHSSHGVRGGVKLRVGADSGRARPIAKNPPERVYPDQHIDSSADTGSTLAN